VAQSSSNAERATDVLLALGRAGQEGMALKDLATELDESKPSLHRTLTALARRGFVEAGPRHGSYRLGPTLYALAQQSVSFSNTVNLLHRPLSAIAAATECVAYLFFPAGIDALCMDVHHTGQPVRTLTAGIGARLPLGIGAASICLLAASDEHSARSTIQANAARYANFPEHDVAAVQGWVNEARTKGYSLERGRFNPGTGALAVAAPPHFGPMRAAISIAGFVERFNDAQIPRLLELMQEELAAI
jgi:DNA-binding IclR family transcriptional regulator